MGKFLKQYEILFKKAKFDLELAKYALDGFYNHKIEIELDNIQIYIDLLDTLKSEVDTLIH
ncbi:MAG: hypothetical protein R6V04_03155 [bacterium]